MKLPPLRYVSTNDWMIKLCRGKSVLHLGCVGDFMDEPSQCLHVELASGTRTLWGVDHDSQGLATVSRWLPEESERVRYIHGNVEKLHELSISRRFEVVLAASIIEHLSNPGYMLTSVRDLLEPEGVFVVVTPHVFGLIQFLRVAFRRTEAVHSEHTCWFCVQTLAELCGRYGLVPTEYLTGYGFRRPSLKLRMKHALGVPFFKVFPHVGGSLIGVFRAEL